MVQLDYDEEMEPLYGMYGSMKAEYEGTAHHQEGGADGLLVPSQESDRTHQGACGQQRNNWWITKRRERASSQEREMPIYG